MILNDVPDDLKKFIESEKVDFSVKAKRENPQASAIGLIIFSLIFNALVGLGILAFILKHLKGNELHFEFFNKPMVGSIHNWQPLIYPGLFYGLFVLAGLAILKKGLSALLQKGGYFVGTDTHLISYNSGTFQVIDWEQFSGNIIVSSKENFGNLELQLRTGKMQNRSKGPDKFIFDTIYMVGIPHVFEIEEKIRQRIKENAPIFNDKQLF